MSEKGEFVDKTIEGAVEKGLQELGIKRDNAVIEVVNDAGSGFLGIGSKQAKVMVAAKLTTKDYIKDFISFILGKMGIDALITVEEEEDGDILFADISGSDVGILIGRRGQHLNALQHLVSVVVHRQYLNFRGRVIVDVENYRQKREEALQQLALNIAYKAERENKEIFLEPMSPQERRIIHLTLKDNEKVSTYSHGEEPYRKVVVTPF